MWIHKYSHISQCISSAEEMVKRYRENPTFELEARFGSVVDNKFIPGVDRLTMDSVIEMMQKSTFVTCQGEWNEEMDLYYLYNHKHLRTRVQYDVIDMNISTHTTEKNLIVPHLDYVSTINENVSDSLHIRLSLKSENEVTNIPNSVNPYLVRIKQRKRFITENKKWAFDFSMTWSGEDKTKAEYSQMHNDPVYEIECECIDSSILNDRDDVYIAASLLMKMHDFLPKNTVLKPLV